MKISFRRIAAGAAACLLLAQGALAESISFSGTVDVNGTVEVYAPIGGTVEQVQAEVGQAVKAGDVLATLSTQKVYAPEDGVVTGVFGVPGDSAENVAARYGAVMYIEGERRYTIAASTENAYNTTENKFVRVGERVYLSCYSDGAHTGEGVITSIQGTDYTVEVTDGEFLIGETVSVFREESCKAASRIGRGVLARTNPTAVTGSGSIVSLAVSDGDSVRRGDLLFETLDGAFDGFYMSGSALVAQTDGVVAQLNVQQGGNVQKDSVAAVIYPANAMRVVAQISESDLGSIREGDQVTVELLWNQDEEVTYDGVITGISHIATESAGNGENADGVTYAVYVNFEADENTRYGMSAIVTTKDGTGDEADEDAEQ